MTEKMKQSVTIPVWVLSLLLPMFVTFLIFVITNMSSQAVVKSQVLNIDQRLNRIENILITNKANETSKQ